MDVRQREYAIGQRGDPVNSLLITKNIATCTGFMGMHPDRGVVFLCHVDTPACTLGFKRLEADLRAKVGDLSGFHLYTVTGVMLKPLAILGAVMMAFSAALLYEHPLGATILVAIALYLSWGNHFATRFICRRFAVETFGSAPEVLLHESVHGGRGNVAISVNADTMEKPEPERYLRKVEKSRYSEPRWWWLGLTKSSKSD